MGKATIYSHLGDGLYSVLYTHDVSGTTTRLAELEALKLALDAQLYDSNGLVAGRSAAEAVYNAASYDFEVALDDWAVCAASLPPCEDLGALMQSVQTLGTARAEAGAALTVIKTAIAENRSQYFAATQEIAYVGNTQTGSGGGLMNVWCIDNDPDNIIPTSTVVGTIETYGAKGGYDGGYLPRKWVNIQAASSAEYSAARDHCVKPVSGIKTAAMWFNWCQWLYAMSRNPQHAVGIVLSKFDPDQDYLDVTLYGTTPGASQPAGWPYDGTSSKMLLNVPVEYLSCGALAFEEGDAVIVRFSGINMATPTVIGFAENPRSCDTSEYRFSCLPRSRANIGGFGDDTSEYGSNPKDYLFVSSSSMTVDKTTLVKNKGNTGDMVNGQYYTWYRAPDRLGHLSYTRIINGVVKLQLTEFGCLAKDCTSETTCISAIYEIVRPKTAISLDSRDRIVTSSTSQIEYNQLFAGSTRQFGYLWGDSDTPLVDFGILTVILGFTSFQYTPSSGPTVTKYVLVKGSLNITNMKFDGINTRIADSIAGLALSPSFRSSATFPVGTVPSPISSSSEEYWRPIKIPNSHAVRFSKSMNYLIGPDNQIYSVNKDTLVNNVSGQPYTLVSDPTTLLPAAVADVRHTYLALDYDDDELVWVRKRDSGVNTSALTCSLGDSYSGTHTSTSSETVYIDASWKSGIVTASYYKSVVSTSYWATGGSSQSASSTTTQTGEEIGSPLVSGDLRKKAISLVINSIVSKDYHWSFSGITELPAAGSTLGYQTDVKNFYIVSNIDQVTLKSSVFAVTETANNIALAGDDWEYYLGEYWHCDPYSTTTSSVGSGGRYYSPSTTKPGVIVAPDATGLAFVFAGSAEFVSVKSQPVDRYTSTYTYTFGRVDFNNYGKTAFHTITPAMMGMSGDFCTLGPVYSLPVIDPP